MGNVTIRVEVSKDTLKKLGKSDAVIAELTKEALLLKNKANATLKQKQEYPDYYFVVAKKHDPPYAKVYTRSNHAKYSNAKHQTLVKII
jgi:hypothetical protein